MNQTFKFLASSTGRIVRIVVGAALFALGFFAMSTTPVLLAMVQEQFPKNRATANGILMATNFVLRPIGTIMVGWMGDRLGLQQAILWGAIFSLLSILPILKLPDKPN